MLLISIHAFPRKNATVSYRDYPTIMDISIHAFPRKNATSVNIPGVVGHVYFNPRIPSQECDIYPLAIVLHSFYFNPRIPSQECDPGRRHILTCLRYFNPRIPSQECDAETIQFAENLNISIHAFPRKNATTGLLSVQTHQTFQSTHSLARMRHKNPGHRGNHISISIHAFPRKNATGS